MNELSLGILEGHILVANQAKIYNKRMILHCYCVSCAAARRVKVRQRVVDDREILRGLKPAMEEHASLPTFLMILMTSIHLLKI